MKPHKCLAFALNTLAFSAQQFDTALREASQQISEFNKISNKISNEKNHPFKRFIGDGYRK